MFNINDILIQSYPLVTWSYVRSLTIDGIINKLSSIQAITNNFFKIIPHKYFLFGNESGAKGMYQTHNNNIIMGFYVDGICLY